MDTTGRPSHSSGRDTTPLRLSSRILLPVLRYCEHAGHDVAALRDVLRPRSGDDIAATYDALTDAKFWAVIAALDPNVALEAPAVTLPGDFHGVGMAVVARETLAAAIGDIVKGASEFADGPAHLDLELSGDSYLLTLRQDHSPALGVDYVTSLIVEVCRRLGGPPASPTRVELQRPVPPPDRLVDYRRRFGASVSFGHDRSVLAFPRPSFERRLSSASPMAAEMCAQLPTGPYLAVSDSSATHAVTGVLTSTLSSRRAGLDLDLDLEAVARALHLSPRTLQRRLATEGTSLRALRREIQLSTGRALVESTTLPIAQIAAIVGFEHQSRFSAAFAEQYGASPSSLRLGRRT